jgi:hypothetical protein
MDQFRNQNRFAHTGPAEQSGLAPLFEGRQQINGLDAGREDFFRGNPMRKFDGRPVNGSQGEVLGPGLAVDGLSENIEHASQKRFSDRRFQSFAAAMHRIIPAQAGGGGQRDAPDLPRIEMIGNLDDDPIVRTGFQQGKNRRQFMGKNSIHHAAPHGTDSAGIWIPGFIHDE